MDWHVVLIVVSRWLHIVAACLALGGVVFMRLLLPVGLKQIGDAELRKAVFLGCRRSFKMVIHLCILIFVVTGTYNALGNWPAYQKSVPLSHAFFGLHVLLAVVVIGISLWVLTGREPSPAAPKAMLLNVLLLLAVVAAASILKYVREHPSPASSSSARSVEP